MIAEIEIHYQINVSDMADSIDAELQEPLMAGKIALESVISVVTEQYSCSCILSMLS